MKIAQVFTRPNCPWCDKVEALLQSKGYALEKTNIYTFADAELKEFADKYKTVPQVWIDKEHIGGCEATEKYLESKLAGKPD